MINQLEEVLALDEAYLTRAIAQEVFGMDKLAPDSVNADGVVINWISDEQELAVETGQFTRSMDVALSLLRSIGDQLSQEQRLRLTHASAACLGQILTVSDDEADGMLFEVVSSLRPLQIAQAFLAAWRHEVEHFGALRALSEDFLMD
ncbi:MAG TPA: hypothetical protein PKD09_05030 [Aggregatilinea sp.]|uniref:hypothetical protein n=1 Tax=Aggregatilinea sp. TaxID=2806333 RepID=UPI002CD47E32|nr:hypothetical protein [Aggregatilinea sp.]HML20989.1 hypothetical protein [Aggregatilinea sp.]